MKRVPPPPVHWPGQASAVPSVGSHAAIAQRRAAVPVAAAPRVFLPPPTRFLQSAVPKPVQRATGAPMIPPPPLRYPGGAAAVLAGPLVQPMMRAASRGLVIQAKWVFIGDSTKKTNMKTVEEDKRYSHDGTEYVVTGWREGIPVVTATTTSTKNNTSNVKDVDMESSDDDELSQYSQHSQSSPLRTFGEFGGKSKNVFGTYMDNRHLDFEPINTSTGLSQIVKTFDTAKNSSANTHLLYRHEDDDKYQAVSIGTALGVTCYLDRFNFKVKKNVQAFWGKTKHIHAEMHLLYELTGGDSGKIKDVLDGYRIVVDKEVCADCYPFVVSAAPDEVRDGTDFYNYGADQRQRWTNWNNPFV